MSKEKFFILSLPLSFLQIVGDPQTWSKTKILFQFLSLSFSSYDKHISRQKVMILAGMIKSEEFYTNYDE